MPTAAPTARAAFGLPICGDIRIGRALPIGMPSSVSQTRTSKSVPIITMRSGRSGRHGIGSKTRAAKRRGARRVLDIGRPSASGRVMSASVGLLLARIGEGEAGKPAVGRHDQRRAERRGMEAVARSQALAAGLPFARRHRLVGDEQVVQPAGAGQADFVGGVEHARRIAQQLARAVERHRLQEGLRRQPGPAAEQVMQLDPA